MWAQPASEQRAQVPGPGLSRTPGDEKQATAGSWQPPSSRDTVSGVPNDTQVALLPQFSPTQWPKTHFEGSGHEPNVAVPGKGQHFAALTSSSMKRGRTSAWIPLESGFARGLMASVFSSLT